MPTMAEYAAGGGYAKDAQAARNVANMPSPSYSSGSSSSSSSRSKIGGVPATPLSTGTSGFMNPPIAGGSGSGFMQIPTASGGVPAPYQVGDVTYTPGPANWGSMSQSQRDSYGSSLSGGNVPPPVNNSNNGMLFPPKQNGRGPGGVVGVEGGWADGTFYPPLQTPQQGNKNFTVTADMGMGGTPPSAQQVKIAIPGQWPGTPTSGTPAPSSPLSGAIGGMPGTTGSDSIFDTKTKSDISAIANARTAELLAKMRTSTDQAKASFQTAYDRQAATTKDSRTLADAAFQTRSDPFNGMTGFNKDVTNREREISDRQAQQDLSTRLGNADMQYADFQNATESQKLQMIDQMINSERQNAYQQAGLTGYLNGQRTVAGQQLDSSNKFQEAGITGKYNGQDTMAQKQNNITNDHWQKSYDQGTTQWDKTFNAGRQDVAYNHGQDQITNNRNAANDTAANTGDYISPQTSATMQKIAANSAAWFNASPTERTRLATENQSLGASIGAKQDENGNWVAPQPQRTIAGRTLDRSIRQDHIALAEALTKAYGVNVYPTDDPAEAFKQVEGRTPIDMQQLEIAKQNAASLEEERKAMSVYRNAEARRQDSLTTNSINTSNRAATNADRTATNQEQNRLISIWHSQGTAPAGITGVPEGTPYTGQTKPVVTKVDSKTSTNNYYDAINQLKANKATKDNAGRYVDSIKDHLSDTDYKNLQKWVEDNTFNPKK